MLRILFSVLAVVAAVLAYIFEMPVLYAVAVVLLLVAVILLVMAVRKRRREAREPYVPPRRAETPEDELKSLGIMDIRPRGASSEAETTPDEEPAPADDQESRTLTAAATPDRVASTEANGQGTSTPASTTSASKGPRPTQGSRARRDEVLAPLLDALRHALGAHTVCLLHQEDIAPQYHIEALVSGTTEVQRRGSFRTNTPLLTPTLAERAVTVRHVGDEGIAAAHLGYYHARPAVREVALAPVPRPADDPSTYFLMADAEKSDRLGAARSRKVLAQFARTVGALLAAADEEGEATEDEASTSGARPRSEIIAEEMAKARTAGTPLALALVHLNQAEAVADRGEGAVAAAERDLAAALQKAAPSCRVERFGELTFGVFYQDATDVEAWTEHLQHHLDDVDGTLAGGVSIGVALLQNRHHDPTAFRTDATDALREAYESGASIILE